MAHGGSLKSGGRGSQLDRAWRAQLRKEVERDYRSKAKAKIKTLKGQVKEAKAEARAAVKAVVASCRLLREKNRHRIRDKRMATRLAINDERDELFGSTREQCMTNKASARDRNAGQLSAAETELADERRELSQAIRVARPASKVLPGSVRTRSRGAAGREAQAESDSEVEGNIDEALLPVWRRIKRKIKATPRMSRTEAFEHWVMENQDDVINWQEQAATADIEAMVREHEAEGHAAWEASGAEVGTWGDKELLGRYDDLRAAEGDVPF